ncbi:hypothetical protein ABIB95_007721 [Bradyrhizobium sp. LA2.1]
MKKSALFTLRVTAEILVAQYLLAESKHSVAAESPSTIGSAMVVDS